MDDNVVEITSTRVRTASRRVEADVVVTTLDDSPAFPLTTVWTPECSSTIRFRDTETSSCAPPNFDIIWRNDGYYSPGICPSGYTAGCTMTWRDIEPSQTAMNCIPSGWDCSTYTFQAVSVDYGEELSPPAFEIHWESSDLPFLETHALRPELLTASSLKTGSGDEAGFRTGSGPAATNDSGPSEVGFVPTSAVIGIAVGAAGLVAIVCAAAFIWYRKRRQKVAGVPASDTFTAERNGSPVIYGGPPVTGAPSQSDAPESPGVMPPELAGPHYHTADGAVELHGQDLLPELPPTEDDISPASGSSAQFQIPQRPVPGEVESGTLLHLSIDRGEDSDAQGSDNIEQVVTRWIISQ